MDAGCSLEGWIDVSRASKSLAFEVALFETQPGQVLRMQNVAVETASEMEMSAIHGEADSALEQTEDTAHMAVDMGIVVCLSVVVRNSPDWDIP